MLLILTHDVDWSRRGPSQDHVLARFHRFRFEDKLRYFIYRENIYDGISLIMDYESMYGIKSTFFFRTVYDDETTVELYSDIINELRRGGWEIGLHANRGDDLGEILKEKKMLERVYGENVASLRVHYLRIVPEIIPKLGSIGFKYDSSVCYSKHRPALESSGCIVFRDVVEIPITVMDTYMFTYWKIDPEKVYNELINILASMASNGIDIATLLWHTNSVRMVGGKEYLKLIEEIWRYEWIEPIRINDLDAKISISRCKQQYT